MSRAHLKNVIGISLGISIIIFGTLFGLWQLDIIVSGPVWYGSNDYGWSYDHRYADDYFQCFLWKTTIGEAYDTLFLITYISPIIGVVIIAMSIWYWVPTYGQKRKLKEDKNERT